MVVIAVNVALTLSKTRLVVWDAFHVQSIRRQAHRRDCSRQLRRVNASLALLGQTEDHVQHATPASSRPMLDRRHVQTVQPIPTRCRGQKSVSVNRDTKALPDRVRRVWKTNSRQGVARDRVNHAGAMRIHRQGALSARAIRGGEGRLPNVSYAPLTGIAMELDMRTRVQ